MSTNIRISISDRCTEISCTHNGKRVDMRRPESVHNVAGMLHDISFQMLGSSNEQLINKANENKTDRDSNQEGVR